MEAGNPPYRAGGHEYAGRGDALRHAAAALPDQGPLETYRVLVWSSASSVCSSVCE
jgi:hypothetical protein